MDTVQFVIFGLSMLCIGLIVGSRDIAGVVSRFTGMSHDAMNTTNYNAGYVDGWWDRDAERRPRRRVGSGR